MRLLRVYINGYRNLKNVTVDFDKDSLTTVVIGENGSGKSNLIEAIVEVFRACDLKTVKTLKFEYVIHYEIKGIRVLLTNVANSKKVGRDEKFDSSEFENNVTGLSSIDARHLPDLIFGYYSGSSRRMEQLFDKHQSNYYDVINKDKPKAEYEEARNSRRLFYCRPIHGVLALACYFAKPSRGEEVKKLLTEKLEITGFHSALGHFKEPSWFNHSNWQKSKSKADEQDGRGRRTYEKLSEQALDMWGARGPAGDCIRYFYNTAFYPVTAAGKVVEDYRQKPRTEAQLACFLRDKKALKTFADNYKDDQDMFASLEAADISDLFAK